MRATRRMQHATVQHATYNMPHRTFDMQRELCTAGAQHALGIVQPTTGNRPASTTCGMVFRPTDRWSGTHRWLQGRHQQGSATAGGLGSRARRGLRDRGAHPPSQRFGAVCSSGSRNDSPAWLQAVKEETHTSTAKDAARPRANWRSPKVHAHAQLVTTRHFCNTAHVAFAACCSLAYAIPWHRVWLSQVCDESSAA
jgi:hypothetical protein